jgi:hypothetical protein
VLCPAPPCIHAPSRAEGTLYHQRVCCALPPGTFLCLHNPWPVFMLPSSRNCHATTGLEGNVCVWGLRPMPTTKGAPSSPCTPHSITAFVFMSTCLPCLLVRRFPSQCRPSPLPPLPTASTTTATASTTAATASTTTATGVVVAATAAAALPVAPLALHRRHYRRSCAAGSCRQPPRLLCHFRPHPPSFPLLSSPFHRRHCRMLECRELLCVT